MKKFVNQRVMFLICQLLLCISNDAYSARLFGTILIGSRGLPLGANSRLIEIDPATGNEINDIGSVGFPVNGLAWDPTTNTLYGSTSEWGRDIMDNPLHNGLITIDINTGAGTPVGSTGWNGTAGLAAINGITSDSSGQLYGWLDHTHSPNNVFFELVTINKATGSYSLIGPAGLGPTGGLGLDFDNLGKLWLYEGFNEESYTLNILSGAASASVAFLPAPNQSVVHGKFDPDDVANSFWGLNRPGHNNPKQINVVDMSTGANVIPSIPTVDSLHTLVFIPGIAPVSSSSTPETIIMLIENQ